MILGKPIEMSVFSKGHLSTMGSTLALSAIIAMKCGKSVKIALPPHFVLFL